MHAHRIALVILLVLSLGYIAFEGRNILSGPSLVITSPTKGFVSTDGFVTVSGHAVRVTGTWLNGKPLVRDKNGTFSETLVLPPGGSILTIRANDQFGRKLTRTRTLFAL